MIYRRLKRRYTGWDGQEISDGRTRGVQHRENQRIHWWLRCWWVISWNLKALFCRHSDTHLIWLINYNYIIIIFFCFNFEFSLSIVQLQSLNNVDAFCTTWEINKCSKKLVQEIQGCTFTTLVRRWPEAAAEVTAGSQEAGSGEDGRRQDVWEHGLQWAEGRTHRVLCTVVRSL